MKDEYIYALGVYQCDERPSGDQLVFQRCIPISFGKSYENEKYIHLANCICLCCRRTSSSFLDGQLRPDSPAGQIIRHYVFNEQWIHDDTLDSNYKISQDIIKSLIFRGKEQCENGIEYSDD